MFDLSIPKILILGVLSLMIFGPEQLPKLAAQAGRALRDLRRLADNAKADLTDGLGPEFRDFDFTDLNPKTFVRKHLLDDLDDLDQYQTADPWPDPAAAPAAAGLTDAGRLEPGEIPPYDLEAT